jgi:beta-1,4-N-acetylglucosaminyltransferase
MPKKQDNIFVTVGTGKFESLIKEIDEIAPKLKEKIVAQIGYGNYKPKNCTWFSFAPNLKKYYQKATFIISHGGPGTVFEILDMRKKFIACANTDRTDPKHQVDFLEAISKETKGLIYCKDISTLHSHIQKAKKQKFEQYKRPQCDMYKEVCDFIERPTVSLKKIYLLKKFIISYFNLAKVIYRSGSENKE